MHLLAADDHGWLVPLFEPIMNRWSHGRLETLGIDAAGRRKVQRVIAQTLAGGEPRKRAEVVSAAVEALGGEADAQHRTHIAFLAVSAGIAVQGPDIGQGTSLIRPEAWLGERPAFDRERSLRELTLRYLRAFAPATEADLAGWAGLPLRDIRAGLGAVAELISERKLAGGDTAFKLRKPATRAAATGVRLIPGFDTYLMGHRDRDFIAAGERWKAILPGGGLLRPAILRDGVALGTWGMRRTGHLAKGHIEPFERLDATTRKSVEAELADVARFEGRFEGADGAPQHIERPS